VVVTAVVVDGEAEGCVREESASRGSVFHESAGGLALKVKEDALLFCVGLGWDMGGVL
jgi:hypothetical protein